MRTKDLLYKIDEYRIFMQYLYANKDHKITVNNGVAALELYMDDDLEIYAKNLIVPNAPPLFYSSELTLANVLFKIIPYLKTQKSQYKTMENKWEEIRTISLEHFALNKMQDHKMNWKSKY